MEHGPEDKLSPPSGKGAANSFTRPGQVPRGHSAIERVLYGQWPLLLQVGGTKRRRGGGRRRERKKKGERKTRGRRMDRNIFLYFDIKYKGETHTRKKKKYAPD